MEEQGKSQAVALVIFMFIIHHVLCRYLISSLFFFLRIQTGKLSEFLTTSCFAHLSFLDRGKKRSSTLNWGEDEDEDDEYSFENEGTMHGLNISDGKEEQPQDTAP